MAILEQLEYFAAVGMSARLVLGVKHLTIDFNIEDAFRSHHQSEVIDHMLVVREDVVSSAHGAI